MVLRLNQYVTKKHVISIFYLKFIIIILVISRYMQNNNHAI